MQKRISLFVGGNVSVRTFCPQEAQKYGCPSWNLGPLQNGNGTGSNLKKAIAKALQMTGIRRAYAPNIVPANATIIDTKMLTVANRLDGKVTLFQNPECPGDSVFLEPGDAFVVQSGGCPLVVAGSNNGLLNVFHAGARSLLGHGINGTIGLGERASIVDTVTEAFANLKVEPRDITMHMLFAIPARMFDHPFDHPIHGSHNLDLYNLLKRWPGSASKTEGGNKFFIDLEKLFTGQAREAGVRNVRVTHSLDELRGMAHTRDGHPDAAHRRNLAVFKRELR